MAIGRGGCGWSPFVVSVVPAGDLLLHTTDYTETVEQPRILLWENP